jgi:signal transduction histidine kinase
VVLNLVMNSIEAIKAADSAERVIIARTRVIDVQTAEVVIEDTGPGIPSESVTQIFDPFFTTKETGMGMGLSIAQTIVKIHGGQIVVEERERGAAVRFTLPLVTARSQTNDVQEAPGVL